MTKFEYKAVKNIQGLCIELYDKDTYTKAARSVLETLEDDFCKKYRNVELVFHARSGEYYTFIDNYNITFFECTFRTEFGYVVHFDDHIHLKEC